MYAQWPELYDWLHAGLDDDVALIVSVARGAGARVLELGCGSGRLLVPLAEAGLRVTGVDNSAAMLDRARLRVADSRAEFVEADMRRPLVGREAAFDCVVIGYNTIQHVEPAALERTLAAARRALRPGGRLLIDTLNPLWLQSAEASADFEHEYTAPLAATGEDVSVWSRLQPSADGESVTVTWRLAPVHGQTIEQSMTFYIHLPHQLLDAAEIAGLVVTELWGDYERTPYDEGSERLILLATAPGPAPD